MALLGRIFISSLLLIAVAILGISGYFYYTYFYKDQSIISPINVTKENTQAGEFIKTEQDDEHLEEQAMKEDEALPKTPQQQKTQEKASLSTQKANTNPDDKSKAFNILILGIDRRTGAQTSWRTDVIQLLTLNKDRTKAVMTHIPRDVWSGKYKINAVYNLEGPIAIRNVIENLTGQRPDRIIRIDFDAFVEMIDAAGGLELNVPKEFTDTSYPNDRNGKDEAIRVHFEQGMQKMNGETALIYARSRKGDNGEGSDYARGFRQQLITQAFIPAVLRPNNLFEPKTAEKIYSIGTKSIYTDISLADAKIIFDLVKNYKNIQVEHISLNTTNYLETPANKAPYGGQWVLIPRGNSTQAIKDNISGLL